jgi:Zn-finger nucleic acid-binding protein
MVKKASPATPKKTSAKTKRAAPAVDESALAVALSSVEKARQELEEARHQLEKTRTDLLDAIAEAGAARADRDRSQQRVLQQAQEIYQLRNQAEASAATGKQLADLEFQLARALGDLDLATQEIANFTLRCPKCGKNFVEEQYEGITIDRCTGCDGIYFDAGEVELLLGKVGGPEKGPDSPPEKSAGWWRNLFRRKQKVHAGIAPQENKS